MPDVEGKLQEPAARAVHARRVQMSLRVLDLT